MFTSGRTTPASWARSGADGTDAGGRGRHPRLDAPNAGYLWPFSWLAAASVAAGTLVLFAVLGTQGQLVALLLFVYLGLALAGGTVPVQALPGVLKLVSEIEPLRQILAGSRAILYFGAAGDAGLTRRAGTPERARRGGS